MPQELVALQPDLHDHAPMRTSLFIILALAACGSDPAVTPDAKPVVIDAAPPAIDAPAGPTLDCPSYCTEIQANCTGANAQYPDMAHCLGTCAAFPVGTSKVTDTAGDTLGCRIYHAGMPSATTPATHCPHAGPAGDVLKDGATALCSGGNVCEDFCNIEVKVCGTTAAPVTGVTPQYADSPDCLAKCAAFPNKTATYLVGAKGDSLACRLYHVTNAAALTDPAMITAHCGHSGPNGGANQATCMTGTAP